MALEYEDRTVCYMRIADWEARVEEAERDAEFDKLGALADALEAVKAEVAQAARSSNGEIAITQLADNILVSQLGDPSSCDISTSFVDAVSSVINVLQKHNHSVQGGVARGKMVHFPSVAFGPAMTAAYYSSTQATENEIVLDGEVAWDARVCTIRRQGSGLALRVLGKSERAT